MNLESLKKMTRHVTEVPRIEEKLIDLDTDDIRRLIQEKEMLYSTRWALCDRTFRSLFAAINQDNYPPIDSFHVALDCETLGDSTVSTHARVWRDRQNDSFHIKPYTIQDGIVNNEYPVETFCDTYEYRYGTHRNHSVKVAVNHDGAEPKLELVRVAGRLVDDPLKYAAEYLSALDNDVARQIEDSEDTLHLIHQALLDDTLNPQYAAKIHQYYS